MNKKKDIQTLNRSAVPSPNGNIKFSLPEIEQFTLSNGLNVMFVKKERLPLMNVALMCEAGSKFDPERKKGLAQLLSTLMDEGAGRYDAMSLSEELEFLGSSLSVSADSDSLYFSLLSLSESFDASLSIFSSVVMEPHLKEEDFLREKSKLKTRILQMHDDPGYLASSIFHRCVFGVHNPYYLPESGTTETVEAITHQDIRLFYDTQVSPDNSTIIAAGSIATEALKEKLESHFGGWSAKQPHMITVPESRTASTKVYLVDKPGSVQTELRIGHASSLRKTEDYFAKLLLNTVLGGQFSSRINLNLREDKGYTYGAHSAFYYEKQAASFCVSAAVKSENTADAVREILKELRLIQEGVSDKELRFARSSIIRKFPSQFETYGQLTRNLSGLVLHGIESGYFNDYIANVKKVTPEEIQKAAENNLFPDRLVIVAVGDREVIASQLRESEALQGAEIIEADHSILDPGGEIG